MSDNDEDLLGNFDDTTNSSLDSGSVPIPQNKLKNQLKEKIGEQARDIDTVEMVQSLTLLILFFMLSLGTDLIRQVWFNYIRIEFNDTGESDDGYVFVWSSFGFCFWSAVFKILCGIGADRLNRKSMILRTPFILMAVLLVYALPQSVENKHYHMATMGMLALKIAQAAFDICFISVLYDLFYDFVEPKFYCLAIGFFSLRFFCATNRTDLFNPWYVIFMFCIPMLLILIMMVDPKKVQSPNIKNG